MDNYLPFGGKTVSFSGVWCHCGPITIFGTARDIVDEGFSSSHLWNHVHRFRLTKSMRGRGSTLYAPTVLAVGEGNIEPVTLADGSAVIRLRYTSKDADGSEHVHQINGTTNLEGLVQAVYPFVWQVNHNAFDDRGILTPTNDSMNHTNECVLDMLPGEVQYDKLSDRLVTDDSENRPEVVSVEYLKKTLMCRVHLNMTCNLR